MKTIKLKIKIGQTTIETALTEIESIINAELEETIPEGETELDIAEIQYANGLEFALICIRKWRLDNITNNKQN